MRYGARVAPPGNLSGSDFAIVDVRSDYWREFWFVSKNDGTGTTWTLDCYGTEAHAKAETHKLAEATHGPSGAGTLDVTMAASVGADFPVGPMVVTVRANGATPDCRIAWTHNETGILIDRVEALLKQYQDPWEMLEKTNLVLGHQVPIALTPAIGISSGAVAMENQVQQFEEHDVQLELHAWVARLDNRDSYKDAVRLGSCLVAIAKEQRTWGGLAADTTILSPAQIGTEQVDGGGILYHALVVLRVRFPDMTPARRVGVDDYGEGGLYAASLT